jgi:hypothetical protein
MRRIIVGVAAGLLLGGSAIASIPPACADTFIRGLKVSHFVGATPGLSSVGLVTVTAGGGKVRHDENYMAETSIKVVPTSWVGTVPTTLWVRGGVVDHPTEGLLRTFGASGPSPEAFRPGTQWVVQVRNADGWMSPHPLPVVGNTVRIPRGIPAADDVDGGDPKVVSLDALRGGAERWSPPSTAGRRPPSEPQHRGRAERSSPPSTIGRRLPPEPQHAGVSEAPPSAPTVCTDG